MSFLSRVVSLAGADAGGSNSPVAQPGSAGTQVVGDFLHASEAPVMYAAPATDVVADDAIVASTGLEPQSGPEPAREARVSVDVGHNVPTVRDAASEPRETSGNSEPRDRFSSQSLLHETLKTPPRFDAISAGLSQRSERSVVDTYAREVSEHPVSRSTHEDPPVLRPAYLFQHAASPAESAPAGDSQNGVAGPSGDARMSSAAQAGSPFNIDSETAPAALAPVASAVADGDGTIRRKPSELVAHADRFVALGESSVTAPESAADDRSRRAGTIIGEDSARTSRPATAVELSSAAFSVPQPTPASASGTALIPPLSPTAAEVPATPARSQQASATLRSALPGTAAADFLSAGIAGPHQTAMLTGRTASVPPFSSTAMGVPEKTVRPQEVSATVRDAAQVAAVTPPDSIAPVPLFSPKAIEAPAKPVRPQQELTTSRGATQTAAAMPPRSAAPTSSLSPTAVKAPEKTARPQEASSVPRPREASRSVASREPAVHIGSIEIVVEAATEPRAAPQPAPARASDFASRHYLRGL